MAISFKELGKKAENLIEQGKEAEQQIQACQAGVSRANSNVIAAARALETACEVDEDGQLAGDPSAAAAQLHIAESQLETSQHALIEAEKKAKEIEAEKENHAGEMEQYTRVEQANLEKLQVLKSMPFGENAKASMEGIAARLNENERARIELLKSMGIDAAPEYVFTGPEGFSGSGFGGLGFSSPDLAGQAGSYNGEGIGSSGVAAPMGGGLTGIGGSSSGNPCFNSRDSLSDSERRVQAIEAARESGKQWANQLNDAQKNSIRDYTEESPNYYYRNINGTLRGREAAFDPGNGERARHIHEALSAASLPQDMTLYRGGSDSILNGLKGVPDSELPGKVFLDKGFVSTSMEDYSALYVNTMLEINVRKGSPAACIQNLSVKGFEQEVLIDKNQVFLVTGVRKENGRRIITCDMLPAFSQ